MNDARTMFTPTMFSRRRMGGWGRSVGLLGALAQQSALMATYANIWKCTEHKYVRADRNIYIYIYIYTHMYNV